MKRSTLYTGLALAGLAMFASVQPAQASDEISSSMNAACVFNAGVCSEVVFTLSILGPDQPYFVKDIQVNDTGSQWQFDSVLEIWSGGTDVLASGSWTASVGGGSMSFSTFEDNGIPWEAAAPITIRVALGAGNTGGPGDYASLYYTANGYTESGSLTGFWSSEGTVTPEPVTTLLLGTGLAGIAAVRRRRKQQIEDEEDTLA